MKCKKCLEKYCEDCGEEILKSIPVQNEYLKQIDTTILNKCSGKRIISKAKSSFPSWIDSDFENYGLEHTSKATEKTDVSVYEMVKDATFVQMFGSLNPDLDKLCLTQDQIIEFCKEHRSRLRTDGYATFFLFKQDDQFCVAGVGVCADGLSVDVRRFGYGPVWAAVCASRVVVPQLTV